MVDYCEEVLSAKFPLRLPCLVLKPKSLILPYVLSEFCEFHSGDFLGLKNPLLYCNSRNGLR